MAQIINFKKEKDLRDCYSNLQEEVTKYYDYLDFIYENLSEKNVKKHERIFHIDELPHKKDDLIYAYLTYRIDIYVNNNSKQLSNEIIETSIIEFLALAHFQNKYILSKEETVKIIKKEKLKLLNKLKSEVLCGGVFNAKKIISKRKYYKICKMLNLQTNIKETLIHYLGIQT